MDALKGKDKYTVFFGGNHSVTDIKTENKTGKTLLVIKDSFAHNLAPFLIKDYDRIIMLDLRYFNRSLKKYLEENKITDSSWGACPPRRAGLGIRTGLATLRTPQKPTQPLKPPKLCFSVRQLVTTPSVSRATSPAQSMWSSMTPNNNAYTSRSRACSPGTSFPRRCACC